MKYIKKPIVVEAFCLGVDPIPEWAANSPNINFVVWDNSELRFVKIKTLEGEVVGTITDYIIKGVKGEIYPCKADIFEMTYNRYEP